MPSLIHITGPNGPLPGASQIEGFEEHTELLGFYQEIASVRGGKGTGRSATLTSVFSFVKALDRISPLLAKLLAENRIISAQLKVIGAATQFGNATPAHTLTLQNGRLLEVRRELSLGSHENGTIFEHVSMEFATVSHETVHNTQSTITLQPGRA